MHFTQIFLLTALVCFFRTIPLHAVELNGIEKYDISRVKGILTRLPGEGHGVRFGSGLSFKKRNRAKASLFYTVSDTPIVDEDGYSYPIIGVLSLKDGRIELNQILPTIIEEQNGLKESFKNFPVDIEGISTAPDGYLWLADERTPSIIKIHAKSGLITDRILPGQGLPTELQLQQHNRGLEGISVFPSGEIFLTMQSMLSNYEASGRFIRMLKVDPETRTSVTYKYPVAAEEYADILDIKVGAVQAIGDSEVLVIEHGPAKDQDSTLARVYKVRIPGDSSEDLEKELIIDLKEQGWNFDKPEGLALFDGGYSLGVTNDPADGESEVFWIFSLKESLTPWGWGEWFVVWFLAIVIVGFTLFSLTIIFQSGELKDAES